MNLKTHIREELWLAVSNSYETESYKNAILDAMHYTSHMLRERADLDGDGVPLVGQALGGKSPRLQINRLQTQSERDVQSGFEHILRGLYLGIRNPRSHEQIEDLKNTADAIIFFVDYVLGIIAESKPPFTIQEFLERVFDPDFVSSERYAQLLAEDIPPRKRSQTLIEIFRKKNQGDGNKLFYIVRDLLFRISTDEINDFWTVVSDELKVTQNNQDIIKTFQILPPENWSRIDETARLRIENKIIQSIKAGESHPLEECNSAGVLGTWAQNFFPFFATTSELALVLVEKLEDDNEVHRRYVGRFFLGILPSIIHSDHHRKRSLKAITNAVKGGDTYLKERLLFHKFVFLPVWQDELLEELEELKDTDPDFFKAFDLSIDEIPF